MTERLPIVVLISGRGSNLQSLIDAAAAGLPVELRAVISNRTEALGLERARQAGIATRTLPHTEFPTREAFDGALSALIDELEPALVVLAGFMRILTPAFVRRYSGRILNIHPALLPAFPGLDTHQRALEAGVPEHGATVHFVTEEVDGGPAIIQARVPVQPGDTEASLAARVLEKEHEILPRAVGWFATGRLRLQESRVWLDGHPLTEPARIE